MEWQPLPVRLCGWGVPAHTCFSSVCQPSTVCGCVCLGVSHYYLTSNMAIGRTDRMGTTKQFKERKIQAANYQKTSAASSLQGSATKTNPSSKSAILFCNSQLRVEAVMEGHKSKLCGAQVRRCPVRQKLYALTNNRDQQQNECISVQQDIWAQTVKNYLVLTAQNYCPITTQHNI